jgi:hypothetical protein
MVGDVAHVEETTGTPMSDDCSRPTQYGRPQGLSPSSWCRHQGIHRVVQSGPDAGRDSMVDRRSIKSCLAGLGDVERPALPGSDPVETGGIPHLLNMVGRRPSFNPLVFTRLRCNPSASGQRSAARTRSRPELVERAARGMAWTDHVQRRRAGRESAVNPRRHATGAGRPGARRTRRWRWQWRPGRRS